MPVPPRMPLPLCRKPGGWQSWTNWSGQYICAALRPFVGALRCKPCQAHSSAPRLVEAAGMPQAHAHGACLCQW